MSGDDVENCLKNTTWYPAMLNQFFGGGYSSGFSTKGGMPVTMVRLNMVYGLGPALQLAEGYTYEPSEKINRALLDRTDPTWPSTWFVPSLLDSHPAFQSVYSVMENWGANHASVCYGHIGAELITLASMLRIPVTMHNVSSDRIFRPSLWKAYGTQNQEATDRFACEKLGPIYK